jgi:hypothetical protein
MTTESQYDWQHEWLADMDARAIEDEIIGALEDYCDLPSAEVAVVMDAVRRYGEARKRHGYYTAQKKG